MEGFVFYVWVQLLEGRIAVNVWETAEQIAASNEAIGAWVIEYTANTAVGDSMVNYGVGEFADAVVEVYDRAPVLPQMEATHEQSTLPVGL